MVIEADFYRVRLRFKRLFADPAIFEDQKNAVRRFLSYPSPSNDQAEESSNSVLLVFEDCRVGEEALESKPDPVEIGFNYHEATILPFLTLETHPRLAYSLTDSSWTV